MKNVNLYRLVDWVKERFPVDVQELKTLTNEPVPNHLKHWWFALGGDAGDPVLHSNCYGSFFVVSLCPHT